MEQQTKMFSVLISAISFGMVMYFNSLIVLWLVIEALIQQIIELLPDSSEDITMKYMLRLTWL